jgi:hypothetical protein
MGTKRLNKLGAITTAAAAFATFLVTASPAQAGKPSGGGGGGSTGSSLQLVVLTGGDSVPNWGEDVTFNVSTTATKAPYVDLVCSQGGTLVYSATAGFFDSYPWPWTRTMNLASNMWTGGDAACTATLYTFDNKARKVTLASLAFTAFA